MPPRRRAAATAGAAVPATTPPLDGLTIAVRGSMLHDCSYQLTRKLAIIKTQTLSSKVSRQTQKSAAKRRAAATATNAPFIRWAHHRL